jgi:DNA repair and recombination protein RAD52
MLVILTLPRPGDQHLSAARGTSANPFEAPVQVISEWTAKEIATLQSRLDKQLGPEYISSRAGPGGQKLHFIAADKCIQLANEIFGFNGWSSTIKEIQVDYVDENPQTGKISLGLSVVVRVTLRDGAFHEDIGYGHVENYKGKGLAFEKAKKEGTTDALKRAMRSFGNVLGNCLYDKDYLTKINKVKAVPHTKWSEDQLYRHAHYGPVRREALAVGDAQSKQETTVAPGLVKGHSVEDEFGEFDIADFNAEAFDPDSDPLLDESSLSLADSANQAPPNQAERRVSGNIPPIVPRNPATLHQPNRPQPNQPPPQRNPPPDIKPLPQQAQQAPPRPPNQNIPQPHTPNANQRYPPPPNARPAAVVAPVVAGRVLNQPSRQAAAMSEGSGMPPPANPSVGFFSARAITDAGSAGDASIAIPPVVDKAAAFNPHAESPSIRKTPGVDHTKSKPLTRDLKHVPSSQAAGGPRPGNIVNPQLDATRRIGAPGSPSPLGNRGSYKPPTMKRPVPTDGNGTKPEAERQPLHEMPVNGGAQNQSGDGPETKRPKMSNGSS